MKLWVPDVSEPRLIDTDREQGQWNEIIREVYDLDNYTHQGCRVEKGDTCVDIGANIGLWTRKAIGDGAYRVFAYEPDRSNFDALVKNTDGMRVQPVLRAVCAEPEPATLWQGCAIGGHTIINMDRGDVPVSVFSTTVDLIFRIHCLTQIGFLKIDCEGAETCVLGGLSDSNIARVRKLAMEYHHWLERYKPDAKQLIMGRLYSSFAHVETKVNPGGEQTMIYCWR